MLLYTYKDNFFSSLENLYDTAEIESFFYILVEEIHQMKRVDLALQRQFLLTDEALQKWSFYISELKKNKPIQYILGKTEFYGLPFEVNEHTLIPRPETEELVDWIIEKNKENKKISILDIGTGSGCIAISLAKNLPNATVYALDISAKALQMAKKNANLNQVENIHFIQQSILDTFSFAEKMDIIVSNPPYVRHLEKVEMQKNVLDYEPHLALFVEDNDALLFYRKITAFAKNNLNLNGQLFFEINQYLGIETLDLIEKEGFRNGILKKDVYGNNRMLFAEK